MIDSGQSLGSSYSHNVSLGDLDDGGDLDAFFTNRSPALNHKVWLNDGSGNFTDSGQSISTGYSLSASLGDIGGDNDFDAFVLSVYTVDNVGLVESTGTWTTDVGTGNGLFNNVSGNAKVTDISQTNGYSDSPMIPTSFQLMMLELTSLPLITLSMKLTENAATLRTEQAAVTMLNLTGQTQSIEAARSSIQDTDFAADAAELAKN